MKYIYVFICFLVFINCDENYQVDEIYPYKDGFCQSVFYIDSNVSLGHYIDSNDYNHIKYLGFKYFLVKGDIDELHDSYIINDVPLVETVFDSNYWVWFDTLTFTLPICFVFSLYTDNKFQNPIPIGTYTYTLPQLLEQQSLLNISGYQITNKTCLECPSDTLFGTYSKFT